ncbi:phosphotransferase [Amycolatopsis sp. CA-230715]|uniref:phosphotransferase n=1 Tax=Amycolatopsis sp. CA-230715 TaxID=2745196 RepID=UPI001C0119B7|nr:phosphotransferase [Amycolatopsis sp. CA-230715]
MSDTVSFPDSWWATLNSSLDALARQHTMRVATPDTEAMSQALASREIERAFPGRVDTTIDDQWVPAHADLNWSNLTSLECWILDWEDHGLAPRGLDAANLWASSLSVPALADRVRRERESDLDTRPGTLMALFCVAKLLNDSSVPGPLRDIATREVDRLLAALR